MNNVSLEFLNDNELLDDEIDELFTQMLHVNPPALLVTDIMKAVSTLPQPIALSTWSGLNLFLAAADADQLS